jgi:hypothetical protein
LNSTSDSYCYLTRLSNRITGLLVISLFTVAGIFGQTTGDYRTTGVATFASATNWQRYNGTGWVVAATPPTQSDNIITIRNGHTATLTVLNTLDQLVVELGGIVTINSGITLTLSNGTGIDLNVEGTVNNSGSISIGAGATISFNSGSNYNHARNGGTVPTATWGPSSNCNITGVTNLMPTGFGQTFGNLTWNSPGHSDNLYLQSNINIVGNFTLSGTGAFNPTDRALRMSNNSTGYTINIGGDFVISNGASFKMNNNSGSCSVNVGGDFSLVNGNLTIVTGGASSTFTVAGDFSMQAGTLIMNENDNVSVGTLNVAGDFTFSGGNINTENNGWSGIINFNGNSVQTYTRTGGTYTRTIHFNVPSGAILDVGTSLIDGSTGYFALNAGAGIITAHSQGLSTSGATGSIRVSGARTYNNGADYTYNSSAPQITGNGLTGSRNLTINNNSGVNLTGNTSVSGILNLTSGILGLNGRTLTINASGVVTCAGSGSINGNAGSLYVINSTNNSGFPVGTYNDVTKNGNSIVTMCGDATINGTFTISSGIFETAEHTLTVAGHSQIAGTLSTNDVTGLANLNTVNLSGGTIGSGTNTGSVNISGALTMPTGDASIGRVNLTASGATTVANPSVLNFTDINGNKIFAGVVTVYGFWNNSADEDIEFRNGFNYSGAGFISGDGTYRFTTNTILFDGSSPMTFTGDVMVDVITVSHFRTTTIEGVLGGSGTWQNMNTSILNYENPVAPMAAGTLDISTNTNTVNYSGTAPQSITPADYHNLTLSGGGAKTLLGNTSISETFTMSSGDLITGAFTPYLTNGLATSLIHSDGIIIGRFERAVNTTSQDYLFPVGRTGQAQPFSIQFASLNPGSLLVSFVSGNPGGVGLPIADGTSDVTAQFETGYWTALARNGLGSTNYSIDLNAAGFGPYTINPSTRIIKRTDLAGTWIVDGVHSDAVGSVIKRSGLDGIHNVGGGTHFAVARCSPRITTHPVSQPLCELSDGGLTVSAVGSGTLTYQWYRVPGITLSNDGHFGGTTTSSLTITGVISSDAGSYYCVVTDQHNNTTQSNTAILTVFPSPTITLDPVEAVCYQATQFILDYSATTNSPSTYSITTGIPAMPGFVPVVDAPITASPLFVTIPSTSPQNTYQFLLTVRNDNGCNSISQAFLVTVIDNEDPTISCPLDITQNVDAGVCNASVVVPNATIRR